MQLFPVDQHGSLGRKEGSGEGRAGYRDSCLGIRALGVGRKEGRGKVMERHPDQASETQTIAPDLSKSLKQFQPLFFIYKMEATTLTEKQAVRSGNCQGEL